MNDKIVIELPLPHKVLHPNGRTRRHGWRAQLVREHRDMATLVARSKAPRKPWKQARYSVHFNLPRKQDEDNLGGWLKAYLDGLQSGGIIQNDSGFVRDSLTMTTGQKQTGGKYGVTFVIWEQP